jgi:hypothetical protein
LTFKRHLISSIVFGYQGVGYHFWYLGWYLRQIFEKFGSAPNIGLNLLFVTFFDFVTIVYNFQKGKTIKLINEMTKFYEEKSVGWNGS